MISLVGQTINLALTEHRVLTAAGPERACGPWVGQPLDDVPARQVLFAALRNASARTSPDDHQSGARRCG